MKLHLRIALAVLLLTLFGAGNFALGQNAATKSGKSALAQELDAARKEFEAAREEFSREMRSAKSDAERGKLWQEKNPQRKFANRAWELAQQNPKDAAALDALMIVIANSGSEELNGKAINLAAQNHIKSEKMATVCEMLVDYGVDNAEKQIREILAMNSHRSVQAAGKLALGKLKKESSPQEAEKLFAEIAEKFKDVKTPDGESPAQVAKGELFEVRNLSIGKVAPDIVGKDMDGKEFKLSDYRGKVVVIDFFGDW